MKAKNTVIKIEFNEDKIRALEGILKKKGKSLDDEIKSFIAREYKRNVPKILREFLDNEEDQEQDKEKNNVEE